MKNLGNNIFSHFQGKSFGVSLGSYYDPCKNRWEIVSKSATGTVLLEATNCDDSDIDCSIDLGSDLPSLTTMPPTFLTTTTQNPNTGTTSFIIEYVNFYLSSEGPGGTGFVYESRISFDPATSSAYHQYADDRGLSFLMFEAEFVESLGGNNVWKTLFGPIYPNRLSQKAYYTTSIDNTGRIPLNANQQFEVGRPYIVNVKDVFNNTASKLFNQQFDQRP